MPTRDPTWLEAADRTAATRINVLFPTPSGLSSLFGTQTMRARMRRTAPGMASPSATMRLFQNATAISPAVSSTHSITAEAIFTLEFAASVLSGMDSVSLEIVATPGEDAGTPVSTVEYGAVEWIARGPA